MSAPEPPFRALLVLREVWRDVVGNHFCSALDVERDSLVVEEAVFAELDDSGGSSAFVVVDASDAFNIVSFRHSSPDFCVVVWVTEPGDAVLVVDEVWDAEC